MFGEIKDYSWEKQKDAQQQLLKDELAERCVNNFKCGILLKEFDIYSLQKEQLDGNFIHVSPEDVRPEMIIKINCTSEKMDDGMTYSGPLEIIVSDFDYRDGHLLVESAKIGCLFSSIDFSNEYRQKRGIGPDYSKGYPNNYISLDLSHVDEKWSSWERDRWC